MNMRIIPLLGPSLNSFKLSKNYARMIKSNLRKFILLWICIWNILTIWTAMWILCYFIRLYWQFCRFIQTKSWSSNAKRK